MAPPSKLIGLTAEEKIARERERNRRKSAALRARKKKQQKDKAAVEEGGSSSSSSQQGATGGEEEQNSGIGQNEAVIKRLVARLAELGEGEQEIGKLVGGEAEERTDGAPPPSLAVASSSGLDLEAQSEGWGLAEFDFASGSLFEPSSLGSTPAAVQQTQALARFGALMNDANSAFSSPLSPDLSQLSHISFPTLNVDQIRLALNLSAASPLVPPRHLPSYSYSSFASSLATYPSSINSDNDTVEWKWRLFEFIRVSHENRHDPSEGYLCNPQMDALVSSAQLTIFKLLTSTSTLQRRAMTDAARPLEKQEDRDYYENTEMDPRIFYVPGLGPRVHISRITQAGVSLTELIGDAADGCTIHGDVWDPTAWSMAKPPGPSLLPAGQVNEINIEHGPDQPVGLQHLVRGASIREIVLGIEKPGWRVLDGSPTLPLVPTPSLLSVVDRMCGSSESCILEKPFWSYWAKGWHAGSIRLFG